MTEKEVDIRDLVCPVPVMEMTKTARTLEKADTLVVIMSTDGKTNVEGWAKGNNFEITDFKKEDDKVVFTMEKQ